MPNRMNPDTPADAATRRVQFFQNGDLRFPVRDGHFFRRAAGRRTVPGQVP